MESDAPKNEYTVLTQKRYLRGRRTIFVNMLVNLFLAVLKGYVGYLARSRAMIADAFHSGGDLLVNMVVLLGFRFSFKPADDCHPYGHGKAETLAQNIVGIIIVAAGGYLVFSSVEAFRVGVTTSPGMWAAIAALISIAVKELLFRYTWKLGQKIKSCAILANARDHRCDVFSSLAALVGVTGARMGDYIGYSALYYLDPLAGIVVSVLIIRMGVEILRDAGKELMDGMCPPETVQEINRIALQVPRVKEVQSIRARCSGPGVLVDLEIGVEGKLSVEEGHQVAHDVEDRLLQEKEDILSIIVHVAPSE